MTNTQPATAPAPPTTQITFTTTAGEPLNAFPGDFPFVVNVTLPEGTPPPQTIDVDISTPSESGTVTLAWTGNAKGPPVYKSNPITLEAGGEGGGTLTVPVPWTAGFTWSTGGIDPITYTDGDTLTATFGGASTTGTVYDSWHTLTIAQATKWLDVQEAFWKKLTDELPPRGEDPDADGLRDQAEMKLDGIRRARESIANDKIWISQRAAAARFWVSWIKDMMPGETDLRDEARLLYNVLEQAKEASMDVILRQFGQIVLGFYDVFTHATMAAQVVEVFGMDIYGKELTLSARILAAIDLASGFAMETAGILGAHKRFTQGVDPNTRPLIELNVPDPITGVKNVPVGTAVPHGSYGLLDDGFVNFRGVADEFGVVIEVRPANVDSMKWQSLGHPRKPMKIKQKTINELDTHLGASPDQIGLVGYFDPKPPTRTPDMTDQMWADLQKRYDQRKKEYLDGREDLGHLVEDGKVRLENGTIVDTGLCGGSGLPITGDYDVWRITRDGQELDAVQAQPIIDRLQQGSANVQHGAHCNWDVPPSQQHIDDKIRNGHATPAQGGEGESLLAIGGRTSGPPRATYSGIDVVPGRPVGDIPSTPAGATGTGADATVLTPGVRAGVRGAVAGAAADDHTTTSTTTTLTAPPRGFPKWLWFVAAGGLLVLVGLGALFLGGGDDGDGEQVTAGDAVDTAHDEDTATTQKPVVIPSGWDATTGVLRDFGLNDAGIAGFLNGGTADAGGLIWSISSEKPGDTNPSIDLTDYAVGLFTVTDAASFDRVLPPGASARGMVACGPTAPAAGDWLVVASRFASPLMESDRRNGFFSLVAESDGNPANNFAFEAPFDWDFYRDTDRWYSHDVMSGRLGSSLVLQDLTRGQPRVTPTSARTFASGMERMWFIPMTELPAPTGIRLASFGQKPGPLDPSTSAGDVSGADPTAPLLAIPDVSIGQLGAPAAAPAATTTTAAPATTARTATTAAPATTADASPEQEARAFLERFNAAAARRDAVTAFDLLHPAVLDRYGEEQCRTYLGNTFGTLRNFTLESVTGPKTISYASDGQTMSIDGGLELNVRFESNGSSQSSIMRLAEAGGGWRWFTDCGTPS